MDIFEGISIPGRYAEFCLVSDIIEANSFERDQSVTSCPPSFNRSEIVVPHPPAPMTAVFIRNIKKTEEQHSPVTMLHNAKLQQKFYAVARLWKTRSISKRFSVFERRRLILAR